MMQIHGVALEDDRDMVVKHQTDTGVVFEAESMAVWQGLAHPGLVMLDVGAYTGLYAIAASLKGARVVAFEPNPRVYARLRENVAYNGIQPDSISCVRMAVSDHLGEAHFVDKPGTPLTSVGRIEDGQGVMRVTLDSFAFPTVHAIKIDVEGHELAVLRGARHLLARDQPWLIIEALTRAAREQHQAFLAPLGYTATMADERNQIWTPPEG